MATPTALSLHTKTLHIDVGRDDLVCPSRVLWPHGGALHAFDVAYVDGVAVVTHTVDDACTDACDWAFVLTLECCTPSGPTAPSSPRPTKEPVEEGDTAPPLVPIIVLSAIALILTVAVFMVGCWMYNNRRRVKEVVAVQESTPFRPRGAVPLIRSLPPQHRVQAYAHLRTNHLRNL